MKVLLVAATTICGRISPAGYGSLLDRRRLEGIRDKTGAGIVGANTLRVEDPEMRGSNGLLNPERIRAIISRSGKVPFADKKMFSHDPAPVVFTADEHSLTLQKRLKGRAQVVPLPHGPHGLSLQAALDFCADRGVETLLLEGGAQLNYAALAEGVVDEIFLTVMPYVSGDSHAAAFADGANPLGHPFLELELLSSEAAASGEIFLHYRIGKEA